MVTVQAAYRDDTEAAKLRYDEEALRWNSAAASLSSAAEVHVRRSARIAAGTAGIVGMVVLLVAGVFSVGVLRVPPHGILSLILLATWGAVVIAYRRARRSAAARAAGAALAPAPSDDPWADLARLAALPPGASLHALAASQERASASLPLIALSLLLPLSIHGALYASAVVATGQADSIGNYDYWIMLGVVAVGHAHLALAWFTRSFAKSLADIADHDLIPEAERRAGKAFWWTVGISAIPGAYLILIPPILVAVTGALFCKPMFRRIAAEVLRERQELGEAPSA
ncbi:MAG: hypothetical protein ABJE95_20970 [Byssovorax sp.]